MLTLKAVKRDLRIYHDHDDDLLREYIAAAHAEALNFCNILSFGKHSTPHDVQQAMKLFIRAMYEGGDEEACRKAAEVKLMPYRKGMGI